MGAVLTLLGLQTMNLKYIVQSAFSVTGVVGAVLTLLVVRSMKSAGQSTFFFYMVAISVADLIRLLSGLVTGMQPRTYEGMTSCTIFLLTDKQNNQDLMFAVNQTFVYSPYISNHGGYVVNYYTAFSDLSSIHIKVTHC